MPLRDGHSERRLNVSERLHRDFENGRTYYPYRWGDDRRAGEPTGAVH